MGKNYNGTQISQSVTVSRWPELPLKTAEIRFLCMTKTEKQSWPREEQSRSSVWL